MKRNQRQVVNDRIERKAAKGKQINSKYMEEREQKAQPITAKNENQKKYLHSLQFNPYTVAKGSAGTGKTYLAACVASNKLLKGEIDKIVVTRPLVGMGKSSGFWPGTIEDKLGPYLAPILSTIKQRLGENKYQADFGKSILIQPLEAVRGMNFDSKTFVIVDESQNCTIEEIRSLTTRMAEGSQIVFCGDSKQKDLNGYSGIEYLCDLFKKHRLEGCTVVEFTSEDIVRSGLVRKFVEIFDAEGSITNVINNYKEAQ